MNTPIVVPAAFAATMATRPATIGPSGGSWLRGLPRLVSDLADHWSLEFDEEPRYLDSAVLVPCLHEGEPATMKVTWPHVDARFEHLALRQWDGRGAVRLFAADPGRWVLLLERLDDDRTLASLPILDACEALGNLFRRLDVAPVARVDDLPTESMRWATASKAGSPFVPRRMTQQAASMLRDLGSESGKDLVHTELHFDNVVAAERESWLAINPVPMNGEWEFAVAPALWSRWQESLEAPNLRAHLRTRLAVICSAAGLDEDRAREWSFVRLVLRALAETENSAPDQEALSRYVAVAKAMQD